MLKIIVSLLLSVPALGECHLYYATKSDLESVKIKNQDIQTLSRTINKALKTSFDFANKLDHYTLGLVSAALLGGNTLEDIKPAEWDRFVLRARLIHQNTALDAVPLRGTKVTLVQGDKSSELITGPDGEFSQSFYEIVPYKRLRLFPQPVLEFKDKYVRTAKIPMTVKVETKSCKVETRLTEVPFSPLLFIISDQD